MARVHFFRRIIIVLLCSLLFLTVAFSISSAGEKRNQPSFDHSDCQAVLLANKDYFPALLSAIDDAQSEIFMLLFSFKTGVHKNSYPDKILEHLAKAVKRGVKVTVILETTGNRTDELNVQNRQTGKLLEDKGVKVYFDSPKTITHTKLVVIDERLVILGSHNLTQSALKHNNEISILLDSPDLARRARSYMLTIIKEAK